MTATAAKVWCRQCETHHECSDDHGPDGHGGSSICCPRQKPIGSVVVEGTDWLLQFREGLAAIEDLAWGHRFGRPGARRIVMTIENRGAAVRLRHNERLRWTEANGTEQTWYGVDVSYVELRVWHDGSVSVERETQR